MISPTEVFEQIDDGGVRFHEPSAPKSDVGEAAKARARPGWAGACSRCQGM